MEITTARSGSLSRRTDICKTWFLWLQVLSTTDEASREEGRADIVLGCVGNEFGVWEGSNRVPNGVDKVSSLSGREPCTAESDKTPEKVEHV